MTIVSYKPYSERIPDGQYSELLRFIRDSPETFLTKHPYQAGGRWTNLETPKLVYKFENGFPIITERKISFWKTPIAEILLFIKGARYLDDMVKGGCSWWTDWVSAEQCAHFGLDPGDLGPGSYGPVLAAFPYFEWEHISSIGMGRYAPRPFNQIENLLQSLRDGLGLNTHVITTWYPPLVMQHSNLKRKAAVAPCHGTIIQCAVTGGNKLSLTMVQRSGDVPVGVVSNIIQYAALTIMLAHVCGYEPYKFVHVINDAQIYENQMDRVDELLERNVIGTQRRAPFPFPTLQLTEEGRGVSDIFDFKADHFELSDYHSHPAMKIPCTL